MVDYKVETKEQFKVLAIGRELTMGTGENPYAAMAEQKVALWESVNQDQRFENLRMQAKNAYEFTVNENIGGAFMYYVGVESDANVEGDDMRSIDFPAGKYIVVEGTAKTAPELFANLEGSAFFEILPNNTEYVYVGGPNAILKTAESATEVKGQAWIPVVAK